MGARALARREELVGAAARRDVIHTAHAKQKFLVLRVLDHYTPHHHQQQAALNHSEFVPTSGDVEVHGLCLRSYHQTRCLVTKKREREQSQEERWQPEHGGR